MGLDMFFEGVKLFSGTGSIFPLMGLKLLGGVGVKRSGEQGMNLPGSRK